MIARWHWTQLSNYYVDRQSQTGAGFALLLCQIRSRSLYTLFWLLTLVLGLSGLGANWTRLVGGASAVVFLSGLMCAVPGSWSRMVS